MKLRTAGTTITLSLLFLVGCDVEGAPPELQESGPRAIEIGQSCDLEIGCGRRDLVCQPQFDGGQVFGAICMLAQAEPCTVWEGPDGPFDLCGRGMACVQSEHDPDKTVCLPMGCVSDDECAMGQSCAAGKCGISRGCGQ